MTPERAVVAVPVATMWSHPGSPRRADAPATAARPDVAGWLAGLDHDGRLGLVGRVVTQAVLGEVATVVGGEDGGWVPIELPAQPSHQRPDGYPGWVRSAHLADAPAAGDEGRSTATVTARLAAAVDDDGTEVLVSCGTRLPVVTAGPGTVTLRAPDGRRLTVDAGATTAIPPTGAGVLGAARRWLGVPYLWGGCSGHGVDCSGLVHLAHRAAGVTVPRDADDQAGAGEPVAPCDAAPGDLWLHARPGEEPHHVSLCAGPGRMLHSPRTGRAVEEIDDTTDPYRRERLVHARRCAGWPTR